MYMYKLFMLSMQCKQAVLKSESVNVNDSRSETNITSNCLTFLEALRSAVYKMFYQRSYLLTYFLTFLLTLCLASNFCFSSKLLFNATDVVSFVFVLCFYRIVLQSKVTIDDAYILT